MPDATNPVFFAPLRVPLVDPRTGQMSREWYLFFQALWMRTGGANGFSFDDVLQGPPVDVGPSDILALLFAGIDELNQLPTIVAELRERLTVVEQELQAIKQSPIL